MSLTNSTSLPLWASILLEGPEPVSSTKREKPAQANVRPDSTTCLVLIAHGRRDPRWREPFERLWATVRRTTSRAVKLAYMEFISPTLTEVAEDCDREGVTELNVLPVFMASGAHVATDIPEQVEQVRERFPEMRVNVLNPLGEDRRMFALMCEIVREKIV